MGLSQSKPPRNDVLAVVASPAASPLPSTPQNMPQDLNTSLNDTAILFSQDAEWLDENEMRAMEDEDAVMVRELSATTTGDLTLEQWLKTREADTKMVVRIGNISTLSKFMGRKTVEYALETDTGTVKRRYKDFVALRYGLEMRFPGAVVPPLPAKKQFGKTDPQFLVKRKRMLQMFLQTVARHPFLSGDDLFVEFIASAARFDRKAAFRSRLWLVKAQKWSVAARRWAQALIQADTLTSPHATMEAAASELALVNKHLQGLKASLKRNSYAVATMAESLSDLAASFHKSSAQESQLVLFAGAADLNAVPDDSTSNEPLAKIFSTTQSLGDQTCEIIRSYTDQTDEAILSPIRFEMACVETLLEALRRTKFSISRHRQAVNAYRQAREQSEFGSFKNGQTALQVAVQAEVPTEGGAQTAQLLTTVNPTEIEKQRKRLQRLRLTAVQAQMNARRDINGVLVIELQRFRAERQFRMNKAVGDYARVHGSQAASVASLWAGHIAVIGNGSQPGYTDHPSRIEVPPSSMSEVPHHHPSLASMLDNSSIMMTDEPVKGLTTRRSSQLRAKYPFQGIHEDELDVTEGEILEGEIDETNPEWVRAKSLVTGKIGLVPKTYVEEVDGQEGNDDEEDEEDLPEMNGEGADKKPWTESKTEGEPTNYIKQTQDSIKGTKRTNADREDL